MEHEPGGVRDLRETLERLVPRERRGGGDYAPRRLRPLTRALRGRLTPGYSGDDNAHSHLRASLLGPSEAIPLVAGRLVLGTWQQLVLIELDDRPRDREVHVQIA